MIHIMMAPPPPNSKISKVTQIAKKQVTVEDITGEFEAINDPEPPSKKSDITREFVSRHKDELRRHIDDLEKMERL
ncbi:putative Acylphosphatase-like domain-containing protein [Helianthus annuus]|nr:putative Acylphosphatase-like domain-containing protein [Helianthus annuus]KAJ0782524.1 putative Acylphosphatase-like domain-containing protein [Helianthus annuus]